MSSDTPRTDAQPPVYEGFPVSREFARALERELNTMREDAARYRYIREGRRGTYNNILIYSGNALDAAIDAARRKLKSVPYPEFCRHPDKCSGLGSCPRDPTCAD